MGSTFGGINTAYSGLVAQRRALEVTGQNVANANTPGYTRQRVTLESRGAPSAPAVYSRYDGAGDGVAVTGISRITDSFETARQQLEHGNLAAADRHATTLTDIEGALPEPGSSGINAALGELWTSFDAVANSTEKNNPGARSNLLQSAAGVADKLHDASANLDQQWSNLRTTLENTVSEINTTASSIADLNLAIKRNTQAGVPSNELADRRDALVLKLSDKIGGVARAGEDGVVDVVVGGSPIVSGVNSITLAVKGDLAPNLPAGNPPRIVYASDNSSVTVTGGDASGLLSGLNATIPSYRKGLDAFASQLATSVNAIHRTGYDVDPAGDPPTGGELRDFFGTNDGSTTYNASNIKVAITDPLKIATSKTPGGNYDNSVMAQLADLSDIDGGPAATYKSLIGRLGVESQTAATRLATRQDVSNKADSAVSNTSGVDTDEEMTNLMAFQRAYESSARVMTTIDSTIQTIINMVGR